jgi:predicted ATPase/class 3 adenylate cyclase
MGPILTSLPEEFQQILQRVQELQGIEITPLEELKGGRTGARLFLVSVKPAGSKKVSHLILKLDHLSPKTKSDESKRHRLAMSQAPPEFAKGHMAEIAYELTHEGSIAIFYSIAGQSLINFHPLSAIQRQNQSETIFQATNDTILSEWNQDPGIEQSVHPHDLLNRWLGYRLKPEANIGRFLEETCHIPQQTGGLLIEGELFPNPLAYGQTRERWDGARPIDIVSGFQHGDLNTGNILVKFAANERDLEAYFLIDFALYKSKMPLLYDQHYLELSFLLRELERVPFQKWVSLVTQFVDQDIPNPRRVPVELTGAMGAINAGRRAFKKWIEKSHPSLSDDLWGQFWLAGTAAGLNFCNKVAISEDERLGGLIFSAAHLKRFCNKFGIPSPGDVAMLYDASQVRMVAPGPYSKRVQVRPAELRKGRPTGTVTFLFTDIVGSTALWEKYPREMAKALALHDQLLEKVAHDYFGFVFKRVGDAFCVAFHSAVDALEAAVAGQRALSTASWQETGPLKVRMGLHSGISEERDGDYFGPAVNRVARLQSVAFGGQILVSQATYELARDQLSTGYQWLDLGPCPLKDLSRPEQVYQLAAPDLVAEFPPLSGQDRFLSSLPEQATSFVGRKRELSQVRSLLEQHRLVTLSGLGGIGKTRLAIETAEAMRNRYRHGVHFVPLLPLNSSMSIAPAIANTLGFLFLEGRAPEKQLLDHLHSKQMLLVLDNMEHLLIDENSTFKAGETLVLIESMLAAAPDLTLLVTSRELLRLPQEKAYVVEGLPLEYSDSPAEGAADLFLRRAQRIRPSFNLTSSEDLKQINEICQLVEGMPLAIELAAAQLRLLSLGEILSGIQDNLDVFTSGLRGASTRHSSMRVVFESSWDGLTPREQLIFAKLSVFRGGFTRQAAAEVAGAAVMDLAALLDKSLVRRSADGRFDMHALIHMFVAEKLEEMPVELAQTRERHYHFYKTLLLEAMGQWQASCEPEFTNALKPEVENMRDCWRWILGQGDWEETAAYLDHFWLFLRLQGRLMEAINLLTQTQLAAQTAEPPAPLIQQGHWERLLGESYLWMSQMSEGYEHFHLALTYLGKKIPQSKTGLLLGISGEIFKQLLHRIWPRYFIGRHAKNQSALKDAVIAFQGLGERSVVDLDSLMAFFSVIRSLNLAEDAMLPDIMAETYSMAGLFLVIVPLKKGSEFYFERAEKLVQENDIRAAKGKVLTLRGFYYYSLGLWNKAEAYCLRGEKVFKELGGDWWLGNNLVQSVCRTLCRGDYEGSKNYALQSGDLGRSHGDPGFIAADYYWQACIELRLNQVERAMEHLQMAAAAPAEVMNRLDWIIVYGALALAYLRQDDFASARKELKKCLALIVEISPPTQPITLVGYTNAAAASLGLLENQPQGNEGQEHRIIARTACSELQKMGRPFLIARPSAYLFQGNFLWLEGKPQKAWQSWQESLKFAQELEMPYEEGLAHYEIGRHLPAGQVSKSGLTGEEHLERAAELFTSLGTTYELDLVHKEFAKSNLNG